MAYINEDKKAPDAEVVLSDGTTQNLRDFWRDKPLLLVFLRHFG
jgi:peroxiredoxin